MNRVILIFFLILNINSFCSKGQFTLPQLQASVYINDSVTTQYYCFAGYCDSLGAFDIIYSIDSLLIPIVTGVELKYIVTSLPSLPDTVYTSQNGLLHVGDTLHYPAANTLYTFYSSGTGCMTLKLIIVGMPTVPFETYPCNLGTVCTLSDCINACHIFINAGAPCVVDNFSWLGEFSFQPQIKIIPNPVSNYFEIKSTHTLNHDFVFSLYTIDGRKIKSEMLPANITRTKFNIDELSNGLYFWKIFDQFGFERTGKLLVNKTK